MTTALDSTKTGYEDLDDNILANIFAYLCYGDIYFCAFVCPNWEKTVEKYFLSLRCIDSYRMVHKSPSGICKGVFRPCQSCQTIGLGKAVNVVELILRISPCTQLRLDIDTFDDICESLRRKQFLQKLEIVKLVASTRVFASAFRKSFPFLKVQLIA
uniref:F-box domain-containing protein n=1 Tax=Trichuris muris TaxID=70415 RepID=A0A5S6Q3H0_TRIMR